jgi:hypothetical protein
MSSAAVALWFLGLPTGAALSHPDPPEEAAGARIAIWY